MQPIDAARSKVIIRPSNTDRALILLIFGFPSGYLLRWGVNLRVQAIAHASNKASKSEAYTGHRTRFALDSNLFISEKHHKRLADFHEDEMIIVQLPPHPHTCMIVR